MINNPGAITECSAVMTRKQQVPAAELDNSKEFTAAGGSSHQHAATFK